MEHVMMPLEISLVENENAVLLSCAERGVPYVVTSEAASVEGLLEEVMHAIPNLTDLPSPEGFSVVRKIKAYHNEMQAMFSPIKGARTYEEVVQFAREHAEKGWGYALIDGNPDFVVIGVFRAA